MYIECHLHVEARNYSDHLRKKPAHLGGGKQREEEKKFLLGYLTF